MRPGGQRSGVTAAVENAVADAALDALLGESSVNPLYDVFRFSERTQRGFGMIRYLYWTERLSQAKSLQLTQAAQLRVPEKLPSLLRQLRAASRRFGHCARTLSRAKGQAWSSVTGASAPPRHRAIDLRYSLA